MHPQQPLSGPIAAPPPLGGAPAPSLAALIEAVPEGWSRVRYEGRPYGLTRRTWGGGRSINVLAEELGGPDRVSANIHRTATAHHLRPCEMPEAKVLDFLRGWEPACPARRAASGGPRKQRR